MEDLHEEIVSRLLKVMKQCTSLPDERFEPRYWQQPLTGEHFGLSAVDLLYLLFELEAEFDVKFSPDLLKQYGFSSINKIHLLLQNICSR